MVNVIEIEGMKDLIKAIGGGGGSDVPKPTSADRGKVLGVKSNADEFEYKNISEVPDSTGATNGDVLTKTASGIGWYPAAKELPTYTAAEDGKVLGVDSNGDLEWATPSCGSGVTTYGFQTPPTVNTMYDVETRQQIAYADININNDTIYSDTSKTIVQATENDLAWLKISDYNIALCIISSVVDMSSTGGAGAYRIKLKYNTDMFQPATYAMTNAPAPKSVPTPTSSDIGKPIICTTSSTNGYVKKITDAYPSATAPAPYSDRVKKTLKTTGVSKKLYYLKVTAEVRLTDADGAHNITEIDISPYVCEYENGIISLPTESNMLSILETNNKMWDSTHTWTNKEMHGITYYYA